MVRDNIEDFHVAYLTDTQMKELNPLIRDAIYTGLVALEESKSDNSALEWLVQTAKMVPGYWENPRLTSGYKSFKRFIQRRNNDLIKLVGGEGIEPIVAP